MISKMNKGTGARGIFNYLYNKVEKGVSEVLDTNMLGNNPRELAKEIGYIRKMKTEITKPMYHISLNLPHGEDLHNSRFIDIAHDYMNEMGFVNNQYMIHRHFDREHNHIHIVLNRVSLDGTLVSDKYDFLRSTKTIRMLEKKYGLQELVSQDKSISKPINKGLIEQYKRTKDVPAKKVLQVLLSNVVPNVSTWDELHLQIKQHNAKMLIHKTSTGKPYGVSFEYNGIAFKGRQLSRDFSFNSITKQIQENYERKYGTSSRTTVESEQTKQRDLLHKSGSRARAAQDIEKTRRSNNSHNEEDSRNQRSFNKMEHTQGNESTICINPSRQSEYTESNNYRDSINEGEYQTGHRRNETGELGNNNSLSDIWTNFIIDNSHNNALKHKSRSSDDDEIMKKKRKKGNQLSM